MRAFLLSFTFNSLAIDSLMCLRKVRGVFRDCKKGVWSECKDSKEDVCRSVCKDSKEDVYDECV